MCCSMSKVERTTWAVTMSVPAATAAGPASRVMSDVVMRVFLYFGPPWWRMGGWVGTQCVPSRAASKKATTRPL